MVIDEEVYLEHYGVKGMKWGVRGFKAGIKPLTGASKAAGKLAVKGILKGTKGAAKFSWKHPKTAAVIAVGSYFAARFVKKKANQKMSEVKNSEQAQAGKARLDKMANNGYFNVSVRTEKIK